MIAARTANSVAAGGWDVPLHQDHHPSLVVDPSKGLFYCYGCGRGGDVIRFAEIYHEVRFPQSSGDAPPMAWPRAGTAGFRKLLSACSLHRHGAAVDYLHQRGFRSPEVIDHMRIGYAPGACLRGWLIERATLGGPVSGGLVTSAGYDAYVRRIVFPLEGNLYGRSISASAPPHRSSAWAVRAACIAGIRSALPGGDPCRGSLRFAVLWQAGFHQCDLQHGNHLSGYQLRQLSDCTRTVYLAFMRTQAAVANRQRKASQPNYASEARMLLKSLTARGHDPNSWFVQAVDRQQFQSLLETLSP